MDAETKEIYIAQLGTFDINNFGDLLFPNKLNFELNNRIENFKIHLFSPKGGNKPFANELVFPLESFESMHHEYSYKVMIVGGGDIIRLDKHICSDYVNNNIDGANLMWKVYNFAEKYAIPILWNSVGVPFDFNTNEQKETILNYCSKVRYLSVRDNHSYIKLKDAGVLSTIYIRPDSLIDIDNMFNESLLKNKFNEFKESRRLDISNFMVFQISPHFLVDMNDVNDISDWLRSVKDNFGVNIILLPICYCHNDIIPLVNIKNIYPDDFILIDEILSPVDIAAFIFSSSFYIGTSLHGNITAYSYGIKHWAINPIKLSKLSGFFNLIQKDDYCVDSVAEINLDHLNLNINNTSRKKYLYKENKKHFDMISKYIIDET